MSGDSPEYVALSRCASSLALLLQHDQSMPAKLYGKGLVTKAIHDWVLSAQGVSDHQKATRLVSCATDRVKDSPNKFHDFLQVLHEDSFFNDIVEKICAEHSMLKWSELTGMALGEIIPQFTDYNCFCLAGNLVSLASSRGAESKESEGGRKCPILSVGCY